MYSNKNILNKNKFSLFNMNLENCSNFEIVLEASCVCESDRAQPGGITWV